MRRSIAGIFLFAVFCPSALPALAQKDPAHDPWAPLQFLIGSWSGVGSGAPSDDVTGTTSFTFDL